MAVVAPPPTRLKKGNLLVPRERSSTPPARSKPSRRPRSCGSSDESREVPIEGFASKRAREGQLLDGLPAGDRKALLACSTPRSFEPNDTLFVQGERHVNNFLICSGLVRTYYTSMTGKEITLAYWSVDDLVGGPDFFDEATQHIWSARVVEKSEVLAIRGSDLAELTSLRPKIARYVIDSLTFKLRWVCSLLQALGTGSVSFRLAYLLVRLAEMYGIPDRDGTVIQYHFSQEDLGNMVGATRQWVSTTLRAFQRDGIVANRNRRIVIRDLSTLRRMAG